MTVLAVPASSMVGRDDDVAALVALLSGPATRLVTLVGPGGVGKSRLAAEVAARLATGPVRFSRTHVLELAPLRDPEAVLDLVGGVVGVRAGTPITVPSVATRIGTARWLLLVDGMERVPTAAPELGELLARCPGLRVLATSRTPLRLRGERLWPVEPLAWAGSSAGMPSGLAARSSAGTSPALRLLVERVTAVRPGFASTGDPASLGGLCRAVGGIPLGLELVAAQLRTREPADLLDELRARHRTLPDVVRWSAGAMSPAERTAFVVLGAFRGPATPVAVHAAHPDTHRGTTEALDRCLTALLDAGLVRVVDRAGRPRVLVPDTVREVAAGLLADSGIAAQVRAAHTAHHLALLRDGTDGELTGSVDDVRQALDDSLVHAPQLLDRRVVERLAAHLVAGCRFAEARRRLTAIGQVATDPAARGAALLRAGTAADRLGDHGAALDLARAADVLFVELDDPAGQCTALSLAGTALRSSGDIAAAGSAHERCLAVAARYGLDRFVVAAEDDLAAALTDIAEYAGADVLRARCERRRAEAGDEVGVAAVLRDRGHGDYLRGDLARAVARLADAVDRLSRLQQRARLGYALAMLADALLAGGDRVGAETAAREAARLSRSLDDPRVSAMAEVSLGDLAAARGDLGEAEARYRAALALTTEITDTVRGLERLAAVLAGSAQEDAAALLAEAGGIREAHGLPVPPVDRPRITDTRRRLGLDPG